MDGRRTSEQPGYLLFQKYGNEFVRRNKFGSKNQELSGARKVPWNCTTIDGLHLKRLENFDSKNLEEEFSMEEVCEAMRKCEDDKAPGPDCLNFNFIKSNWEVIKEDVMDFFVEFHRDGSLIMELNTTFIALIPKIPKTVTMGDFRPINLVGSMYKVVVKVLANRIKKAIAKVINPNVNFGQVFLKGFYVVIGKASDIRKKLEEFDSGASTGFRLPWRGFCLPKVEFFAWQLFKGRVLVADVLQRFGMGMDLVCKLCNKEKETLNHTFIHCVWS
ncbi:hypothetical protein Dsin_023849 [Dipteronia sinensis]|uniref:Reverse transcriptase zinc-binding domain-containing protein n=1 Tax=Dipteronia sinensis TaxID=43782 RepID=A0AAE0A4D1_9ROSI|nr:hypothetical protein Dsin_023849 [Dipteronia sinensis]